MKDQVVEEDIMYLIIDLFCGAGGVTHGIEMARHNGKKIAKVIAAINHDPKAIASHVANHPDVEPFTEDIRDIEKIMPRLSAHVEKYRMQYPDAKVIIWASLECTNFSNAKGGLPRDADSRTLAWDLHPYLDAIQPDGLWIENVKEFMAWGPLKAKQGKVKGTPEGEGMFCYLRVDKKKRKVGPYLIPESRTRGRDYIRWVKSVQDKGYTFSWKMLIAADYGGYTIRKRYFAQFARPGLPIVWPQQTHTKNPKKNGLFQDLKKWNAVKEVLDLDQHGKSIFMREDPLVENTIKRIYAGMVKFVANGDESFLEKAYSGSYGDKVQSLDSPAPTITTVPHERVVRPIFIQKYKTGQVGSSLVEPAHTLTTQFGQTLVHAQFDDEIHSRFIVQYNGKPGKYEHTIEKPANTLTTKDRLSLVTGKQWIDRQYGSGSPVASIEHPSDTIVQNPKQRLCTPKHWIDKQYGSDKNHQSINQPAGTITTNPKLMVCSAYIMDTNFNNVGQSIEDPMRTITADRHQHYLLNPQWGGTSSDLEAPCFTLIARMDKAPPYVVSSETGEGMIVIYPHDSDTMVKLKLFMAEYGIVDILMRALNMMELKRITSLPEDYVLKGNQTDGKRFIGNAVVTVIPQKKIEANAEELIELRKKQLQTLVA